MGNSSLFSKWMSLSPLEISKLEFPLDLRLKQEDIFATRDLMEIASIKCERLFSVLILLFDSLRNGQICLYLDSLPAKYEIFFPKEELSEFMESTEQGKYFPLIGGEDSSPVVCFNDKEKGRVLYFQRYFVHEKRLKEQLSLFVSASNQKEEHSISEIILKLYEPERVLNKSGVPIVSDPVQVGAIKTSLKSGFSVISGGPGTGKTSIMVNLLRGFLEMGYDSDSMALCAPTGRAAQRMTEALNQGLCSIKSLTDEEKQLFDLKGQTLHKLLGYTSRGGFFRNREHPLQHQILIMDEASMVDVILMSRFFEALVPGYSKVVFLGDKDQLPSVEAGAVFAHLIPSEGQQSIWPASVLKTCYRSDKNILSIASAINKNLDLTEVFSKGNESFQFHSSRDFSLPEFLKAWLNDLIEPLSQMHQFCSTSSVSQWEEKRESFYSLFETLESRGILCASKAGRFGTDALNQECRAYICRKLTVRQGMGMHPGMPAMITRNDYSLELFNGDSGVIFEDINLNSYFVTRKEGVLSIYPLERIDSPISSYAVTIHKSQGSEYDKIAVFLPDEAGFLKMLSPQLLYTAVTRAKSSVEMVGDLKTLAQRMRAFEERG
jgi:exodeoxyribonuclease V alpha subunit